MYTKDGEKYFVVDGHVHFWDASEENVANQYGEGFIRCFYDYHANLSPEEYVWPLEKYRRYSEDTMMTDLFEDGHVDVAIFQPTYLSDFYVNGFNTTEDDAVLATKHPDRFVLNSAFDPRDGDAAKDHLREMKDKYDITGVKLYTAEWKGDSRGYELSEDFVQPFFELCIELRIKNIHVHKGPTIWPLNRDAFDVHDIDVVASRYPMLTWIVEHVGLPRLEDFCWIATQEPNVYGGLAVAIPFIHTRPRFFAKIIGELNYWLGEDRILFASDYALWHPKWLVEQFVDFQIPEDLQGEYGELTPDIKRKVLGLNAARLYDIPVPDDVPRGAEPDLGVAADPRLAELVR